MHGVLTRIAYKRGSWEFVWMTVDDEHERRLHTIVWQDITITLQWSQKYCTWRYDLSTKNSWPCPTMSPVVSWSQCHDCSTRTWFCPFFYNHQTISTAQQQYNARPHMVYLAYFGWDLVKIWITAASRWVARLTEQWALARDILAYTDSADDARRIEEVWATTAWCREIVRTSTKISYLRWQIKDNTTRQLFAKKRSLIGHYASLDDANVTYNTIYEKHRSLFASPLQDISKEPSISGNVVCVLGWVVLLQNGWQLFLHNLKSRVWYEVSIKHWIQQMSWFVTQWSLF